MSPAAQEVGVNMYMVLLNDKVSEELLEAGQEDVEMVTGTVADRLPREARIVNVPTTGIPTAVRVPVVPFTLYTPVGLSMEYVTPGGLPTNATCPTLASLLQFVGEKVYCGLVNSSAVLHFGLLTTIVAVVELPKLHRLGPLACSSSRSTCW